MFSRISVLWNRHATDFKFQAATLRMRDAQQMVHGGETFHAFAWLRKMRAFSKQNYLFALRLLDSLCHHNKVVASQKDFHDAKPTHTKKSQGCNARSSQRFQASRGHHYVDIIVTPVRLRSNFHANIGGNTFVHGRGKRNSWSILFSILLGQLGK